jgi:hypothetical protein
MGQTGTENYDVASELVGLRVDHAQSNAKGGRTGEVPSKTRERDTKKQKDTMRETMTKSGKRGPQQNGYNTTVRVLNRQ